MITTLCDYKNCKEKASISIEKGVVGYASMQTHKEADLCFDHSNVSINSVHIKWRIRGW